QRWLDHVTEFADESEQDVLETWQRGIDAVRTGDRSWAATHLDWAIKERLFHQVAERRGVDLGDPAIERLDLAYHDIDPTQSVSLLKACYSLPFPVGCAAYLVDARMTSRQSAADPLVALEYAPSVSQIRRQPDEVSDQQLADSPQPIAALVEEDYHEEIVEI